jgi:hypothetical protein
LCCYVLAQGGSIHGKLCPFTVCKTIEWILIIFYIGDVPGMVHPKIADGGDGLKI